VEETREQGNAQDESRREEVVRKQGMRAETETEATPLTPKRGKVGLVPWTRDTEFQPFRVVDVEETDIFKTVGLAGFVPRRTPSTPATVHRHVTQLTPWLFWWNPAPVPATSWKPRFVAPANLHLDFELMQRRVISARTALQSFECPPTPLQRELARAELRRLSLQLGGRQKESAKQSQLQTLERQLEDKRRAALQGVNPRSNVLETCKKMRKVEGEAEMQWVDLVHPARAIQALDCLAALKLIHGEAETAASLIRRAQALLSRSLSREVARGESQSLSNVGAALWSHLAACLVQLGDVDQAVEACRLAVEQLGRDAQPSQLAATLHVQALCLVAADAVEPALESCTMAVRVVEGKFTQTEVRRSEIGVGRCVGGKCHGRVVEHGLSVSRWTVECRCVECSV